MNEPIWLSVARAFVGITEVVGATSNPVILQWAKFIGAPEWYHDDDQAWCAVWMNRVLRACGLGMSGTGFDLIRAKSFEQYGEPLPEPLLGAILTFSRPEGAHVGLYVGQSVEAFRVLGGNQGNAVSETWIRKQRLTSARWPTGQPRPATGPVMLLADGTPLSHNEA